LQFAIETSALRAADTLGPMRNSGLDAAGYIPWGTHLCQFYGTKADLIDTLIPYFKAGLEANEFCMWVTSEPLTAAEAEAALAKALPRFSRFKANGQIEIVDYSRWYTLDGKFDADRVLQGWIGKLEAALERGFQGLRGTGNIFWLEKEYWQDFTLYEALVDRAISTRRMLALCTYPIERCSIREILDVSANHQLTLVREGERWEVLQNVTRLRAEEALRESDARFHSLFDNMAEGYALHEIVTDEGGVPCDYRFLDMNPAFERLTGLQRSAVRGKRVTEVLPGLEAHWIERYGRVALTGQPAHFESHAAALQRWYQVFAYRTAPGQFAAVFSDITERKSHEEQIGLLMAEVNHRSKNMLTVVQAIARQTASTNPDDFIERFSERVKALAASHDLLVKNEWKNVELGELVRSQLAHFDDLIGTRIDLKGPELRVSAAAAQTIGMTMHELATNAGKYGALSNGAGRLEIEWSLRAGGASDIFAISWRESGGPLVAAPARRGFGSTVISRMAGESLDAEVELKFEPEGLSWRLECPAPEVTGGTASLMQSCSRRT
jgi:PAS domain S-box-containing protein